MSTLTKILIVLLTLFAIFLCGIVVTYVANADDYKQKYNERRDELRASEEKVKGLKNQLKEKSAETQQLEAKLNNKIVSLETKLKQTQGDLDNAEREKAALLQEAGKWKAITKDFYETNDKQGQLLKNTLERLNKVEAQQIKTQKELKETTSALMEKMVIIETLEAKEKRLLEEKTELQSKLNQLLQPVGEIAAEAMPVTPEKGLAIPAGPLTEQISLQGLITDVDLKNSLASISIGQADGVEEGMKFHVTRSDVFICDILIIDVDAENAVGVLELVQQQPKVGDNVSTNL